MSKPMDAAGVLKMIKEKDVKYVDLRFTDPRGKMQHLTMDVSQMHEDAWAEGLMFDGSSIAGWKAINESDMVLMPDPPPPTSTRSMPSPRSPCSATFSSPARARATAATRA
jgi:glutamine synthetase